MINRQLLLSEAMPFVRYAEDVKVPRSKGNFRVRAYDHRLFYVVSGCVHVETDEGTWDVGAGGVLYWVSGTSYSFCAVEGSALRLIKLNFDFTQAHSALTQPIPVVAADEWEAEEQLERICFTDAVMLNGPLILPKVPQLLTYLHAIVEEMTVPRSFASFQVGNLANIVLTLLCREAQRQRGAKKAPAASRAILDYLNEHYAEDITNQKLAERFGYHANYIGQVVAEQTGMPVHRYLLRLRIRQALNLLTTTQLPVSEVAHAVGFKSASYFSQYFKQCTGHAPGKFRVE